MKGISTHEVLQAPVPTAIKDEGKVRIGTVSPAFPPVRPTPAKLVDHAQVRMGTVSPAFPPARAP